MNNEHACTIVTAATAAVMRTISKRLDPNHCDGMFQVGLNALGSLPGAPATHFINNGFMPKLFIEALGSPSQARSRAQALATAAGTTFPLTLAQVTTALSGCTITKGKRTLVVDGVSTAVDETPHELIARLGLQFMRQAI